MTNLKDRQPENLNDLQDNKFLVTFDRIPTVAFKCVRANIPGVSADMPRQITPRVDSPLPGTKFTFEMFKMDFIVNEDLKNWLEIYKWINHYSGAQDPKDYLKLRREARIGDIRPQYSSCTLHVNTDLNHGNLVVDFNLMFPTNLTGIQFDSTINDIRPVVCSATFAYTDYNITFTGLPK